MSEEKTLYLKKELPANYQQSIDSYATGLEKRYIESKKLDFKQTEIKVYQDVLAECFSKQGQNYMKNCRELALEYLELIKLPESTNL